MTISRLYLPRRTFLRGLGVSLALPLLDSMVPAFAKTATSAARGVPRLSVVYVPNGVEMPRWTPPSDALELMSITAPLEQHKSRLLMISGLANAPAFPIDGEGTGDHARASATFLTGVHPKKTEGRDLRAGVSMDQIAAAAHRHDDATAVARAVPGLERPARRL